MSPVRIALLSILAWAPPVGAVSDLIGTSGEYGYETGTKGAVTNRELADQLYKAALENEKAAWSSFPPNVALLSKALQQSKDAKLADDQAKEFARAALHGAQSGSQSGDFVNDRYGIVSEKQLKALATTSSPYMPQVEKTLGGYGMKLSDDKMSIKTPFGNFAINGEDSKLVGAMRGAAKALGYSPSDVDKGVKAALGERDALAKKLSEKAGRTVASGDEKASGGKGGNGTSGGTADSEAPANSSDNSDSPHATESRLIDESLNAPPKPNYDALEEENKAERKRLAGQMGLDLNTDPIGRPDQNIFQMIYLRYQSKVSSGELTPY
ncbi:MAG: hypothetical protein AB7F86_13525 [Bdellovibrionales bacterium]